MKKTSSSKSAFFYVRTSIGLALILAGVLLALMSLGQFKAQAQQQRKTASSDRNDLLFKALVPPMFDCSQLSALGIDKQENLRAGVIQIYCGAKGGSATDEDGNYSVAQDVLAPLLGGVDADVVNPQTDTGTHITQSESFIAANPDNPSIVVVANNDSRDWGSFIDISSVSYSNNGGTSFTRLTNSSGHSPFPNTFGDPVILYNRPTATWFTVWLDGGCGGQGLGGYKTTDPSVATGWTHFCVHNSSSDDRESGWADNNPSSAFYGRMYVSWNDFAAGGNLKVRFSTDNGTTWTEKQLAPASPFIRDVQITGDATNGTVFVAGMNEGGGGLANRQNLLYRSTDGGNTWTNTYTGPSFAAPGSTLCASNTYFACMFTGPAYWRHMGWGQPAAHAGVVSYVYDSKSGSDVGNVFYIRSTDNGSTFSAPFQLNTDTTTRPQWQPNISAGSDGSLLAVWYDARESTSCVKGSTSTPCYRMWGRQSTDNGATWAADQAFSDVVTPLPGQPDSGIVTEYAGDYDYSFASPAGHLHTWTDGRIPISNASQQDVFFDQVAIGSSVDTVTIVKAQWSTSRQQLVVNATDSNPAAVLTCKRTSDGFVFGPMRTRGDGTYQGKFNGVTTNPVNITLTSNLGGTASADVRVRP